MTSDMQYPSDSERHRMPKVSPNRWADYAMAEAKYVDVIPSVAEGGYSLMTPLFYHRQAAVRRTIKIVIV